MSQDPAFRGTLITLGGIAVLVAALLGALQNDASRRATRAAAEGSRLAVVIFEEATSAGLTLNLNASVIRDQFEFETNSTVIDAFTRSDSASGLGAIARADMRSAGRLENVWSGLIGKPLGLESESALVLELEAFERRTDEMVARQNAVLDEADRLGRRSRSASQGLLLVATSGALFALTGSIHDRQPARVALATGTVVLAAAVILGVSALLV